MSDSPKGRGEAQWTTIVTSAPEVAPERDEKRARTLSDVMKQNTAESNPAGVDRSRVRSESIDSGLRKRLEVVASEALHPKMQELLARYEETPKSGPADLKTLPVPKRSSTRSASSSSSGSSSSKESSHLSVPKSPSGGQRISISLPEACDNMSDAGTSCAGSQSNSRRPSRIIDAQELQQAVNVHIGDVVKNEEKRSQTEVASREYSDSCSPKVNRNKWSPEFAFANTHSSRKESLNRISKTVKMGSYSTAVTWSLGVVIAICIALECAGLLMLSNTLQIWRLGIVERAISDLRSYSLAFGFLLAYALIAALTSSLLVVFVAPRSSGSGIPDLKAFLNGNSIPMLFSFRTWLSRSLGLVLVTSAGLFAGTEGPSGHIGAITSLGIAQFVYNHFREYLPFFGHHSSCEFVAMGAATGVAAAFGSPVGGILFSVEEASSFWSKNLTWRSFVSSIIAAAVAKSANAGFRDLPLSGFIEFPDLQVGYELWEVAPFVVIAVCTSLLGALFCWFVERIALLRGRLCMFRGWRRNCAVQVVEVLVVSILTMTVCFWLPLLVGCEQLGPTRASSSTGDDVGAWHVGKQARTVCNEGHYSDIGTLLLQPKEAAIKHLFTRSFDGGAEFATGRLFLCSGIVFVLTLITYGTAIPSGLFIPNILIGACFGRGVGQVVDSAFEGNVHPGVHALVGAAGMLAGIGRMSVSLTMIILEITNSMRLLLPVLLCVLISKALADQLTDSVYDIGIALHPLKDISVLQGELDEEDMPLLRYLTVHDACTVEVHTLKSQEHESAIVSLLMQTKFSGFPLVSTPEHEVVGLILREKLVEVLKNSSDGPINLLQYADESPEVKHWNTPLAKAHRHFIAAGLRHLCVVDEEHRLVGIMTRSDLAPMSHPKTRRQAVQDLMLRKQSVLSQANMDIDVAYDSDASDTTSVVSASPRGGRFPW